MQIANVNMRFLLTLSLVLWVCEHWIYVLCIDTDAFTKVVKFPGQLIFNKHTLDTIYVVSSIDCARVCGNMDGCYGYKFHSNNKTCQVRSYIYDDKNIGKKEPPFSSYASTEVPPCSEAPDIPNTRKDTKGCKVGDVTTYSCHPDFLQCRVKKTKNSVCQPTGQWSRVEIQCRQFRWHNPKTLVKHRPPCNGTERFILTLHVTPTRKTRFSVSIMKGNDTVLIADFRLNFTDCIDILVLNSEIGGIWRKEVRAPLAMTTGKKLSIVITLNKGRYRVKVDERFIKGYKNPKPNSYPDYVMVERDATVQLVEIKQEIKNPKRA